MTTLLAVGGLAHMTMIDLGPEGHVDMQGTRYCLREMNAAITDVLYWQSYRYAKAESSRFDQVPRHILGGLCEPRDRYCLDLTTEVYEVVIRRLHAEIARIAPGIKFHAIDLRERDCIITGSRFSDIWNRTDLLKGTTLWPLVLCDDH